MDHRKSFLCVFVFYKHTLRRDKVTWNDEEFAVSYTCLANEVRVGAYYLRFVLSSAFDVEALGQASNRFLGQLYHAFLTAEELDVKVGCLNAMTKVRVTMRDSFMCRYSRTITTHTYAHTAHNTYTLRIHTHTHTHKYTHKRTHKHTHTSCTPYTHV